jgi:hypothetical protein
MLTKPNQAQAATASGRSMCRVSDQRLKVLETGLVLDLMRFLSLRLKPKAAAAPRAGSGPGTGGTKSAVAQTKEVLFGAPVKNGESTLPDSESHARESTRTDVLVEYAKSGPKVESWIFVPSKVLTAVANWLVNDTLDHQGMVPPFAAVLNLLTLAL